MMTTLSRVALLLVACGCGAGQPSAAPSRPPAMDAGSAVAPATDDGGQTSADAGESPLLPEEEW